MDLPPIGILGAGNVGTTLGRRFAALGHGVFYGVRDTQGIKTTAALAGHPGMAAAVAPGELSEQARIIVLTVPGDAVVAAVGELGPLDGTILIDATNPILPHLAGLAVGTTDSGGEQVQRAAPRARVVKAFNTIGVEVMAEPRFADGIAALPLCGDDAQAKAAVMELARSLGFAPIDSGPLRVARYLEPWAMIWITLAYQAGLGRRFAFGLLR